MSFGFFGIQFGFALQNANVSRIFETLGADLKAIPILWIAAPLTGLIVQPIIGYFSDRDMVLHGRAVDLTFSRGCLCFGCSFNYAQLSTSLGGGWYALDYGCIH